MLPVRANIVLYSIWGQVWHFVGRHDSVSQLSDYSHVCSALASKFLGLFGFGYQLTEGLFSQVSETQIQIFRNYYFSHPYALYLTCLHSYESTKITSFVVKKM